MEASTLQDGRSPWQRHLVGVLKKHASHMHRVEAAVPRPGGLFAKRCKAIPVEDRDHTVALAWYMRRHLREGGAVFSVLTGHQHFI